MDDVDADTDTLRTYCMRFQNENEEHIWNICDDRHFLEMLGRYRKNRDKGVEGLTLAGTMLLAGMTEAYDRAATAKLKGYVREDDTPLRKAVIESCVNMIIYAAYMLEGALKITKSVEGLEITSPDILNLNYSRQYNLGKIILCSCY